MAVVLIPQAVAYSTLAGMPPEHGLYAAAFAPIAAAFFASSPYLQTGPVAMTSVLTFGALSVLATPFGNEYVAMAALLAVAVGIVRIVLGLLRVGQVAYLMSQPMLLGFMSAAACLIIASQLPTLLGVTAPGNGFVGDALYAVSRFRQWQWPSIGLGAMTVLLSRYGRRIHPLFPGVLVAVVLGLTIGTLTAYPGAMVGAIATGLPAPTLALPWTSLPVLVVPGVVIALVGFAEPAAIARTYAAQDRQTWDPHREFVGQGVANVAAGVVMGFPVGGSFSRTAINRMAGGTSRWSGAVAGLVVLAFLPFADVLAGLPRAVLAGIIIVAVVGLVRLRELYRLIDLSRAEAMVALATFVATIALAPRIDLGVVIGISLAVLIHLRRELSMEVSAESVGDTLTLSPIGVLFFGSAPGLDRALLDRLAQHPDTTRLVIDLNQLGRIDYSGAVVLRSVVNEATQAGLAVEVTNTPPQAERIISRVLPSVPRRSTH